PAGKGSRIMSRRAFCKVLLAAVVAVFSLFLLSGALFAQGRSDEAFERVIEVQERHTERLMAIKGVVGTAVGLDQNNLAVIKVLTARGAVAGIPGMLDGVRVQPVVTGEFYALPKGGNGNGKGGGKPDKGGGNDPTARQGRPVPIGVSTGHADITAGTIGCRVTDGVNVYALSNNHVYANENLANAGLNGDPVLQPGPYDGGASPADYLGMLYDFVPIDFSGGDNVVDAAIASTTTDLLGNATLSDGYGTPKSTTAEATINQKVKKYGRTTGQTKGQVYAINATVNVGYDSGVARFVNQIIITPGNFSAGGDSGSLVVVDDKKGRNEGPDHLRPVGLLFAGSSTYTVANPIDAVLGAFGVSVDGEQ
ncbi:MAG: Nal1-like putative serine protease, partial [Planctomycetota bacterium]